MSLPGSLNRECPTLALAWELAAEEVWEEKMAEVQDEAWGEVCGEALRMEEVLADMAEVKENKFQLFGCKI